MKLRFRRLASLRWVLAVVCACLVGLWVFSEFRPIVVQVPEFDGSGRTGHMVIMTDGRVALGRATYSWSIAARIIWPDREEYSAGRWWFAWRRVPTTWSLTIPLWMPALLLISLTALSWRGALRDRRRLAITHCKKCGYDRQGLPSAAVCPECGAERASRRGAEARGDDGGR